MNSILRAVASYLEAKVLKLQFQWASEFRKAQVALHDLDYEILSASTDPSVSDAQRLCLEAKRKATCEWIELLRAQQIHGPGRDEGVKP